MNQFDFIFLSITFLSAIFGLIRGFTKEILSFISWLVAVSMAYYFFPYAKNILSNYVKNPLLADIASVFIVFILFLILMTVTSNLLSSWIKQSSLGGIDRALGFFYGILRGCVLLFTFELVLSCIWVKSQHPDIIKNGRFSNFMYKGSSIFYSILPSKTQNLIKEIQEKKISELNKTAKSFKEFSNSVNNIAPIVQEQLNMSNEKNITADELSDLKPKVVEKKNKPTKSNNEDIALDRLIDQSIDEEEQ